MAHRKANTYSHNTAVWPAGNLPAGCREAADAIPLRRRPVAESAVVQVLLIDTFTHSGFTRLYPSDHLPVQSR